MIFSRKLLDEIKQKPLLELIGKYTKLTRSGSCWIGRCPHPDHKDTNPSFRVWCINGFWSWNCMGCNCGKKDIKNHIYGTDAIAFVQWISDFKGSKEKKSWQEAVEYLLDFFNMKIEKSEQDIQIEKFTSFYYKSYQKNLGKDGLTYLESRGLTKEDALKYNLGYIYNHITIPIKNRQGQIIGYCARAISDFNISKYKISANSDIFKKGDNFFNQEKVKENSPVFIFEGVFDAILCEKYGLKNTLSILGTTLTENQIYLLKKWNCHPILCYDGDGAGRQAIENSIELLKKYDIYPDIIELPSGKDPADLACQYKTNIVTYIYSHKYIYWHWLLKEVEKYYTSQIINLKESIMPQILEAKKSCGGSTIFYNYIKNIFGVEFNNEDSKNHQTNKTKTFFTTEVKRENSRRFNEQKQQYQSFV